MRGDVLLVLDLLGQPVQGGDQAPSAAPGLWALAMWSGRSSASCVAVSRVSRQLVGDRQLYLVDVKGERGRRRVQRPARLGVARDQVFLVDQVTSVGGVMGSLVWLASRPYARRSKPWAGADPAGRRGVSIAVSGEDPGRRATLRWRRSGQFHAHRGG